MHTVDAARTSRGARAIAARIAFGALFVVLLPALLIAWAQRLDAWVPLPALGSLSLGYALVVLGLGVMMAGTAALWRYGQGLPMSAFPPERLVTRGIYRFIADPLYVGAVAVSVGVSLAARSPAGLWIVSPLFAMVCVAWVMGFERDATQRRFGARVIPDLRLPRERDDVPAPVVRLSVYLLVLLPWLVLYLAVERLGVPPSAFTLNLTIDAHIPVVPWTEGVYALAYPMVALAPLVARRERDLRQFAVRGLVATAFILPVYLLFPVVFDARPVVGDGFWQRLMLWERVGDSALTAFPAFHVVWACIAAELYATTWSRGWLAWLVAALIAVSCTTTGMHSAADVAAGGVAYLLVAQAGHIWRAVLRASEVTANSWRETTVGPLRFMSHGALAALGVAIGAPVGFWLGGTDLLWWIAGAALASGVAAALWAQLVEGSPQLLRPFGYFGAVFGALMVIVAAAALGVDGWLLLAAFLTGLAFAQGVARLRCLVNGCCHGRATTEALGIRYTHPRTRPVRLAGLGGVPIHPTQVYALGFTVLVGLVLVRLWMLAVPLPFIAGMYFILVGIGRFIEEHFRGEPQTATIAGLRLYQWLTIVFIVGGAVLTAMPGARAPTPAPLGPEAMALTLGLAIVALALSGVDFPRSNRRFSRLA